MAEYQIAGNLTIPSPAYQIYQIFQIYQKPEQIILILKNGHW